MLFIVDDFDGLVLPGGHDKGVKEYLESKTLQQQVVAFFNATKPVGAICHGVVLAARSIDPVSNQSVLFDYKTTSLIEVAGNVSL
jgi:protease I